MIQEQWKQIPFVHHFVNLRKDEANVTIPFAVGGATQQGTAHKLDNQNNQDATSIFISNDFIIGIISDGCASTHDELRNSISNNEVGAKLLCHILIRHARKIMFTDGIEDPQHLLQELSERTSKELISIVNILCEKNELSKEIFIWDFLMTTIIGFIVTRHQYLIFYYGDGIIGINGKISILEENGSYFAETIIGKRCPNRYSGVSKNNGLKSFASGLSSDLQSIFLATDGFYEIAKNHNDNLVQFIQQASLKVNNGFNFVLPEFRKQILRNEGIIKDKSTTTWPKDDASFLLLRSIEQTTNNSTAVEPPIEELHNDNNK